jgi:hypothetical protein
VTYYEIACVLCGDHMPVQQEGTLEEAISNALRRHRKLRELTDVEIHRCEVGENGDITRRVVIVWPMNSHEH